VRPTHHNGAPPCYRGMTRREFALGAASLAAMGVKPVFAGDSPRLAASKRWFREAQFGMMAHWGLYTLLGGEWNGRNARHAYGEWIQHSERIPLKQYAALGAAFNPLLFNPLDWMKRARDAGMKYFVITSKHHDGFALFRSKVSKYNVVDGSAYRRDIIEQIAEACRATGVKLGLYYSQDLDWSERNGGGRMVMEPWPYGPNGASELHPWGNDWDFDGKDYDFQQYLDAKSLPQVEEILTQYGELCLIWFDVPQTMTKAQSTAFRDLVRKHQPGCLINGRIGNDMGDYFTPDDNAISVNTEADKLYETVGTMNDSWGYRPTDTHYKSVAELLEIKRRCAAIGSNYMLNVGPDAMGRLPVAAIDILNGIATR